nr:bifunctional hydroxymethylpyrimidine kinase/phosphomethylpyrimidine kinase [Massilia sp. TS11]
MNATGTGADALVAAAHGCHGLAVTTMLLVRDSAGLEDSEPTEAEFLVDQARMLLEDMQVAAFKVGAIASLEQVSAIAEVVSDYIDAPLVLDPFCSSLPEAGMQDDELLLAVRQILIPQATVLLLSRSELETLAETWREPVDDDMLEADVAELTAMGCQFVLVFGGAENGQRANYLFDADGLVEKDVCDSLPGVFLGAGGTLSAALACLLAQDMDAIEAVRAAQEYTIGTLAQAQRFGMGKLVPNKLYPFTPSDQDPA